MINLEKCSSYLFVTGNKYKILSNYILANYKLSSNIYLLHQMQNTYYFKISLSKYYIPQQKYQGFNKSTKHFKNMQQSYSIE